jgi:hypothetical protein
MWTELKLDGICNIAQQPYRNSGHIMFVYLWSIIHVLQLMPIAECTQDLRKSLLQCIGLINSSDDLVLHLLEYAHV